MFKLAMFQTIGMTRRFDFARSALNFTDHTRFLFYTCLFSNISVELHDKNFNVLLTLATISLPICMLFVTCHLLNIDNIKSNSIPYAFWK